MLDQPAVQLVDRQVHEVVVDVVAHDLGEQGSDQGREWLLAEARDQRVGDEVGDVLVAHLAQPDGRDLRHLVDHATYVG